MNKEMKELLEVLYDIGYIEKIENVEASIDPELLELLHELGYITK